MTAVIEEQAPGKRKGKPQDPRESKFMKPVEHDQEQRGWQLLAMCEGVDPELFYAYESLIKQRQAKAICAVCPVMEECRAAVMAEEAQLGGTPWANLRFRWGIRGGLNAGERWDLVNPDLAAERRRKEVVMRKRKAKKGRGKSQPG